MVLEQRDFFCLYGERLKPALARMDAGFDGGESVGIRERSPFVFYSHWWGQKPINVAAASLLRHDATPLMLVFVNPQRYLDRAQVAVGKQRQLVLGTTRQLPRCSLFRLKPGVLRPSCISNDGERKGCGVAQDKTGSSRL